MLKLENIELTLGRKTQLERQIFHNLCLQVAKGEFVVIIGGNGAGKTTLFNVISGSLVPDKGRVLINDQDVTMKGQTALAPLIARVMQDPKVGTMEQMTIEENMSFAYTRDKNRGLFPHNSRERRELFRSKLAQLGMGLEDRLSDLVGTLSGGQRQALSMVMAILADSKILLLDEITAALDPKVAEKVMQLAAKLVAEEKRTTIMITHNMIQALEYGDRTLVLSQGKIVKQFGYQEKSLLTPIALASELSVV